MTFCRSEAYWGAMEKDHQASQERAHPGLHKARGYPALAPLLRPPTPIPLAEAAAS